MSGLQWLFVLGAGVAGYLGVSFLIDRRKKERVGHSTGRMFDQAAYTPSERESAWDEFNRGTKD
jgi:hypothetical protein